MDSKEVASVLLLATAVWLFLTASSAVISMAQVMSDLPCQFWSTLYKPHQTVGAATINYINTHNSYCDPDWTYNVDVKIYGNANAVLGY